MGSAAKADLVVTTWIWGGAYDESYVQRLARAIRRNLPEPHRFLCITDKPRPLPGIEQAPIPDSELTIMKGCFARIRLFETDWQRRLGIKEGSRILNLDLDLIVTGPIGGLLRRDDDFTILQGVNASNPCPYNGSVWMLRAGARRDVWDDFSLDNYIKLGVPFDSYPDDQGWFAYKMPDAGAFRPSDGVYAFQKPGWPSGVALPHDAKIVAFPGWRDPAKFQHVPWIKEHWRL
jgi:hypothetical protein